MHSPYPTLAVNLLVSAVIMYFVMFAMIDGPGDFRHNLNMGYMALMMAAPMGVLMLALMGEMYTNARLNIGLYIAFVAVFAAAFAATRLQTLIGDEQLLRAMIPHHSGAILMCREAQLTDPEIVALCEEIIEAQREEIAQMNAILARY
ncbi:hypothetical protein VE25_03680 [Devosia geojensis]|uniref:DUF305 domain-containing protein n=1 Tax=Devosia geojensis TaxID=443610 RepID=A0A0F5FWI6_9HYPH|nr:DUF305 domain-containing protein [Devosia geojensis]KKB13188.1 hypothetical protein VE25_03680 [Devosia geojensis]